MSAVREPAIGMRDNVSWYAPSVGLTGGTLAHVEPGRVGKGDVFAIGRNNRKFDGRVRRVGGDSLFSSRTRSSSERKPEDHGDECNEYNRNYQNISPSTCSDG